MFKAYNEDQEQDRRFDLETMRLQTMLLINVNLKPIHQYKNPKKFLPFSWEKPEASDIEIWTEDQWQAVEKKLGLIK